MTAVRSRRRVRFHAIHPFAAFLLIACFGLLFGCRGPSDIEEDFVFTEQDVARYRELAREAEEGSKRTGTGAVMGADDTDLTDGARPYLEGVGGSGAVSSVRAGNVPVLDLSLLPTYKAIRVGGANAAGNTFRVTNDFLNVRANPSAGAGNVERLTRGDLLDVLAFVNAGWAKVKTIAGGKEGFVAAQYIARMTSDDRLAEEKKKYDGQYYVNFRFLNVRRAPEQGGEKLGELTALAVVKPISIQGAWAKIPFEGKEGFASMTYLKPFLPRFLVRQERFELPVLHYRLGQTDVAEAIVRHVQAFKQDGYTLWTMRDFHDFLLRQEQQDIRLPAKVAIVALSGVTPETLRAASDVLTKGGVRATIFVETRHLGLSAITEKMVLNLLANGFDLESAGHTGDDLRALTNAQVELELKQSRQLLEGFTHKRIIAVGYPQGGVNDRVQQIAMEAGYLLGLTSAPDRAFTRDQLLRLPSFLIFPSMSAEEVLRMVKGA